jgi:hypothetical protein
VYRSNQKLSIDYRFKPKRECDCKRVIEEFEKLHEELLCREDKTMSSSEAPIRD